MTTEEEPTNERSQYEALLENMQREFKVLSEAQVANTESIQQVQADMDDRFGQFDRRVMVLEVKDIDLDERVGALATLIDRKIHTVDEKISMLDAKVDRKLHALEVRVGAVTTRVGTLDMRVGTVDARVVALDAKVDRKLHALETRAGALEARLGTLEAKISYELSRIAMHLGLGVAPRPAGHL